MNKVVSDVLLALILISTLSVVFNVKPVKAEWTGGTIYIRADGSIDPPDAPIITDDNVTYTLTDNIISSGDGIGITVERDNIILDGNDYTLIFQGTLPYPYIPFHPYYSGIILSGRSNVTIKKVNIKNFLYGIYLDYSSNNSISGNNITNNRYGIILVYSLYNSISGNNIKANNYTAIFLRYSSYNNIFGNNIVNNPAGIQLIASSNYNSICENTFTNDGLVVSGSYNNIVDSNLVNGKPLVYFERVSNLKVEDAGQVILVNCSNIRVENLNLYKATLGVELWQTNNTTISGNNLTNNYGGIYLGGSSFNNSISGNNIAANEHYGIRIDDSFNNSIFGNNIKANRDGIIFISSSNNSFYHNNFIDNSRQIYDWSWDYPDYTSINIWDNGYPCGGNYWSDYTGVDERNGPDQDLPGSDGIGDTPYVIDANNMDRYPLMGPFGGLTLQGGNMTAFPSSNVCLIFENVTTEGLTTVNVTDVGPEPPSGFKLARNYYDIKTTANYTGAIKIRIVYDDSNMTMEEESSLRLMQWDETLQQWIDVTTALDTENNVIYGETSHLSIFAIVTPLYVPPTTYTLTIITTVGGTTNPAPGTHAYTVGSSVQVTAIPDANYVFDHWELDTVNVGSANPYTVLMNNNHTLKAVFTYSPPPPLTASITPLSASIPVGQSVTFTSTVSGGYTPYSYQWYLNGNPVAGATSDTWTFKPTTAGIYYVYLKVTDAKGNIAQSETARIVVSTVPVGGYSTPIQTPSTTKHLTPYLIVTSTLTIALTTIKRAHKTTKKTKKPP